MGDVRLSPLKESDREQFILDNQEAFRYGAMEEFGLRDNHFEEDGEIISRETIEKSIDGGKYLSGCEYIKKCDPPYRRLRNAPNMSLKSGMLLCQNSCLI